MALMKKQLAAQETPQVQPVVAPCVLTQEPDEEIKEPVEKKPRVVVREKARAVVQQAEEVPSLSSKIFKTVIVGAFTVGAFYFGNIHFQRNKVKPTQPPHRPEQQQVPFPFLAPQGSISARQEPHVPVGSSGYFR